MILKYSVRQIEVENKAVYDEFLYNVHKKFPFSDIFTAIEPVTIPAHKHPDFEARIFISGCASFNIEGTIIECAPGSYIEIQPNISHSFTYSGGEELKVIRFFSDNESWHAIYC